MVQLSSHASKVVLIVESGRKICQAKRASCKCKYYDSRASLASSLQEFNASTELLQYNCF